MDTKDKEPDIDELAESVAELIKQKYGKKKQVIRWRARERRQHL